MKSPSLITLLACCLLLVSSTAAAPTELEGERAAANSACPSPEEARAKMTVPDGYEVRCFAHEPLVVNPVAMTWDTRGRLWIVEAFEYPEGTPLPVEKRPFGGEAKDDQYHPVPPHCIPQSEISNLRSQIPKDRVVILEDTDNDGVADKRTVFVEGLNLASAIICGDDGIYVGQQPHIIHFLDADHDDKPEQWRVILTGFGREDTHELVNSFTWGPDGWLYMTHGVFTHCAVRRPGQPEKEGFKFDAGIGRARPVTGAFLPRGSDGARNGPATAPAWEFEVFADGTSNPWGCDYDAAGNFFVSACVIDHFFHMAPGGIYVRQGGAPENPYSYELLPSIVKHRHFRAAYAGVQIYQGGVYPRDTWGHAFIGNIHDNAIHEEIITPVGSTFKCEPRRDFLRANNGWFRPVSTQTGPDGFLWIMDWCDKYPCYQNAKANPTGVDRERGRIWRVVHVGVQASAGQASNPKTPPKGGTPTISGSRPTKDMDLAKLTTPELVKLLEHPNNWMRRLGSRQIVEQWTGEWRETTKAPPRELLRPLLRADKTDSSLAAAWTLTACGDTNEDVFRTLVRSAQPACRAWAARLLGERSRDEGKHVSFYNYKSTLESDPEISVRLATAIAMRQEGSHWLTVDPDPTWIPQKIFPSGEDYERKLLAQGFGIYSKSKADADQLLAHALWMSLGEGFRLHPPHAMSFFNVMAPRCEPLSHSLSQKAMRRLCDTRKPENLDLALDFLVKIKDHDVLLAHALDGLVKGQEGGMIKPTKDVSALLSEWRKHANADVRKSAFTLSVLWGDTGAISHLAAVLVTPKAPSAEVLDALQRLRGVTAPAYKKALLKLIREGLPSHPAEVAITAIRSVADLGSEEFTVPLTKLAASKDYGTQLAALGALSNRADWTHAMLDAIDAKKISATGFPVSVRRQLATSKDKAIRDHASKVLGAWKESGDDIKALIAAKKTACLEGEPDLANGRTLFTATCGVCHTFYGGGQKVGPELIGSGRSNLDALLANVIDPNQIIGNGYENFTITTTDNRTLAGRVTEDTPSHVKLLAIGGAETVVPRDQIVSSVNTHQSLMPMGFGNLPDAAFRDIVWYLLAPPEEGPLTPEKKKLLSTSIDLAAPAKPKGTDWRAIDWESVAHWNPDWKVNAPEFERTPQKLAEYHGKTNVLLMHSFPDKKTPASLERKLKVEAGKTKLHVNVAADDRGDWKLKALINGQAVKEMDVDHEQPRWKAVEIDLSKWQGQEITIRLEAHPTGWSWEFGYWQGIELR